MRRLHLILELMFNRPRRTKGISLNFADEGVPTWLWKFASVVSNDWLLDILDRESPAKILATFLIRANLHGADRVSFTRPFGEKSLLFVKLDGPAGEMELDPCPGWFLDMVKRCITERGSINVQSQGEIDGRLEIHEDTSAWDFKVVAERSELVLLRVRTVQPGVIRA